MNRLTGFILLVLAISGCGTQKYPSNWTEPIANLPDGCLALAGDYDGSISAGPSRMGLNDILSGYHNPRYGIEKVTIRFPARGILDVVAGPGIHEYQFSEKDKTLICGPGGAELFVNGGWMDQEVAGVSHIKVTLSKDKDGYLIVKREEAGVAFYGVIAIPGGDTNWYRFGSYKYPSAMPVPKSIADAHPGKYKISHILLNTEDEANAALAKLNRGYDFGKLAKESSKDAGSSGNDGDLGWTFLDEYPKTFAMAVRSLKIGQISKPVHTEYGWHIIKLDDIRKVGPAANN